MPSVRVKRLKSSNNLGRKGSLGIGPEIKKDNKLVDDSKKILEVDKDEPSR